MPPSGSVVPIDGWRVDLERLRRDHRGRRTFGGTGIVADLELPAARVPAGEVSHELEIDAAGTEAVVSGTIRFDWRAECRRCLQPVDGETAVEVREVFQRFPTEGETWPIVDDEIDLEPMVRELVLLALPTTVVCRGDCPGPPDGDHVVGLEPEGDDAPGEPTGDPRWAALDQLDFD